MYILQIFQIFIHLTLKNDKYTCEKLTADISIFRSNTLCICIVFVICFFIYILMYIYALYIIINL